MYSLPDFLRGLSDFFGFATPWASFDSSLTKNEKKKSQLKKTKTTVSDKNSWDTLAKRCFFPSRTHLVPLKVVYRSSVTKSCTPTLRGQGDPQSVPTILTETVVE